jgi:hypothetical protein
MIDQTAIGVIGGDDLDLRFTVLNYDNSVYDLTGATITWTMIDSRGYLVIASNEVAIGIIDASQGKCSVLIPGTVSTRIKNDLFIHALRIFKGGATSTPYLGYINGMADPFKATAVAGTNVISLKARHAA